MIETPDLVLRQGCQEDWQDLYENLWQHDSVFCFMFSKATPSADVARKKTIAYVQMQKRFQQNTSFTKKYPENVLELQD